MQLRRFSGDGAERERHQNCPSAPSPDRMRIRNILVAADNGIGVFRQ